MHASNHTILHSHTHALKCSFYKDVFAQLSHLPLEYRIQSAVFRSLSMEFQKSAKRQLLGHYLPGISLLWTVLMGQAEMMLIRLCPTALLWDSRPLSWLCALQRSSATHSSLGQNTQLRESWRKATQFFHASFFPLQREEGKSTKRRKKKSERVINEKQTQGRIWYDCFLLGRWCNKPKQVFLSPYTAPSQLVSLATLWRNNHKNNIWTF